MKKFKPPTIEEAKEYANSIGFKSFEARKWWYFYDAKNWMIGKNKMQKWRSAIQTWFIGSAEWEAKKAAEEAKAQPKPKPAIVTATPEQRAVIKRQAGLLANKIERKRGSLEDKKQEQIRRLKNGKHD